MRRRADERQGSDPARVAPAYGLDLSSLLSSAGGLTEPARAFLLGGYAGTWIDAAAAATVKISRRSLRAMNATLGSGIIVALPASACPVAETARVAFWMAEESAGQCGPCINGLDSIADALADISEGVAQATAVRDIERWAKLAAGRGACAHPDGTARFVISALGVFAQEFDDHARHGPCDACQRLPVLLTPARRTSVR